MFSMALAGAAFVAGLMTKGLTRKGARGGCPCANEAQGECEQCMLDRCAW